MPADIPFQEILTGVRDITVSGALVFILVGGYRKWWVWGWQLEEEKQRLIEAKKDGKYWQDFSFSQLEQTGQAIRRLPKPSPQGE